MLILNDKQIRHKVTRLAYEIIEQNIEDKDIHLIGINNKGYAFAQLILKELQKISPEDLCFHLHRIKLNPAKPTAQEIEIDTDIQKLKNSNIIIIDDVANTGRTLFFACKPFLNIIIKSLQMAVLIDRKHKAFPIHVDYVGMSLATTLTENIEVELGIPGDFSAHLV